ncbi:ATP-binding protein [Streptomyces sp. NBC_00386]|jgi:anti-sigma regulatory factor (Ser/Thr protein kinase)|uniref:ATP-binding protein n=1 Tax=Streptomyces sp. NBC_00386 TaxID=2975734 RepID=UPI002E246217
MDESPRNGDGERPDAAPPLEASFALDSDASRIAQARHLAAAFLTKVRDDYGIPVASPAVEIVQLIVSELVTNARKYAPGPALLHLRITGPVLQVELWDSNPVLPAAKDPDPERIGQHGLEIVTALARTVTVEQTPGGKRITADVLLSTAAA